MLEGSSEFCYDKNIRSAPCFCSSYLSAPTKMITEMVADQVAPSYWVPNKDVNVTKSFVLSKIKIIDFFLLSMKECWSCKLGFGSDHSKHHCRGRL